MPTWIKVVYTLSLCILAAIILILSVIEKSFGMESQKNGRFLNAVISMSSLLFAMTMTQMCVVATS